MSLLIKALNKAEEAQSAKPEQAKPERVKTKQQTPNVDNLVDNADLVLSLSPAASRPNVSLDAPLNQVRETMSDDASPAYSSLNTMPKQANINASAKSAANVFSSKGMAPKKNSQLLAIVAGLALITLLGMGTYFYRFLDRSPEPVPLRLAKTPPPVTASQQVAVAPLSVSKSRGSARP